MKNRKLALCRYYRTIRSFLPCSRKLKNKILEEIQGNVEHYLEENPDADMARIEERFGKPESIAAAYVDDMDTRELLRALRIRRKILTIVVSCVCMILLMWGITVGAAYVDARDSSHGYTQEYIIE